MKSKKKCSYMNFEPLNGFGSIKYSTDTANSSNLSSLQTILAVLDTISSLFLLRESQAFITPCQKSQP